jgi:TonB family protein
VNFRLRPQDESDVTRTVEQLAAAWNERKVDAALRQFDFSSVPAAALGRNGMRSEAEQRAWLTEQMPAAPAPLRLAPRVVRFVGRSLAYVEVPLQAAAGAPPAAPLHGTMVKRNDTWRLVRLDWSEAPGQGTPVRAGQGSIKEPRKIKDVVPSYPTSLLEAGVSGTVVLECLIDTEGAVTDMQVVNGHPSLVKLAQDAVKKWRYTPTLLDGVPVPVVMTVTVNFRVQ